MKLKVFTQLTLAVSVLVCVGTATQSRLNEGAALGWCVAAMILAVMMIANSAVREE